MDQIGAKESMNENDISPFSNGDKAICKDGKRKASHSKSLYILHR